MFGKARSGRDAFTFSLNGLTTIASFTIAPAIAQDSINKMWDQRLRRTPEDQPDTAEEFRVIRDLFGLPRWLRAA